MIYEMHLINLARWTGKRHTHRSGFAWGVFANGKLICIVDNDPAEIMGDL